MLFRDSRSRISSFVRQTRRGRKTDWRGRAKNKNKKSFVSFTLQRNDDDLGERKPASRAWLTWHLHTHTHTHTRVRRGVCKTSRPRFVGWNGSIVDDGRLCCYVSSRCFTNSQTLWYSVPTGGKELESSTVWKITRQTGAQREGIKGMWARFEGGMLTTFSLKERWNWLTF